MPVTSFSAAGASLGVTVQAPTLTVVGNTNALTISTAGYTRSLSFTFGTGATALYVNQLHNSVRAIATSGSDTLTLSALVGTSTSSGTTTAMYDVLNQVTPVFARIRAILLEHLTTGDTVGSSDPTPLGASSLTIGNAASNPWPGFAASTGTVALANGDSIARVSRSAAGMLVGSGSTDQLKIANADASIIAVYRIVIFGCSS